jgi:hypothetical protein
MRRPFTLGQVESLGPHRPLRPGEKRDSAAMNQVSALPRGRALDPGPLICDRLDMLVTGDPISELDAALRAAGATWCAAHQHGDPPPPNDSCGGSTCAWTNVTNSSPIAASPRRLPTAVDPITGSPLGPPGAA